MDSERLNQIKEEIEASPVLAAAYAVAKLGHTGQEMKGPDDIELPSYVDGHLLEMYDLACRLGFKLGDHDDDENDLKILCAILLHDVIEDSDKIKALNGTEGVGVQLPVIDTADKFIEIFKNELDAKDEDNLVNHEVFARQIAETALEDTNLDLLPEGKRITQVRRARDTMSERARLVKFFDVSHHMICAVTLPVHKWTKEENLLRLAKSLEVGEACMSNHRDGRYPQLTHFIHLLYRKVYDIVKSNEDGVPQSFDDELKGIISQAIRHTTTLHKLEPLPNSSKVEINHPVYVQREKTIKGLCRIYLDRDGNVVSYSIYMNPVKPYNHPANVVSEEFRNALEFAKNGELVRSASHEVLEADKIKTLEEESQKQREVEHFIRIKRLHPPSCRTFHLETPMALSQFLDIASEKGAVSRKGVLDIKNSLALNGYAHATGGGKSVKAMVA